VVEILGPGVFASDVLTLNGLDDRRESQRVVTQAQELIDGHAVHAEQAFFSTCGSSLSVKSAMMSVVCPVRSCWRPATRTSPWSPDWS